MYEDTLLEKLNYILGIKTELMNTISDIGSKSIDADTLFKDYPDKIREVHSDIKEVCRYLKITVDGGDANDLENVEVLTDTLPYIQSILESKDKLSINLNAIGTFCENTEPLESLVDKVYSGSIALLEKVDKLEADINTLKADKENLLVENNDLKNNIKDLETRLDEINGEQV